MPAAEALEAAGSPRRLRVVVTRPEPQAAEWVRLLQARGVDALALPLIGIAPPDDPAAVGAAWHDLARQRLVVFVSPNAAEQFFVARPPAALWPAATRAGSPGPGTSRTLRRLGVPAQSIVEPAPESPQFDSAALWSALAGADWRDAKVLIVRGDGGRDWLSDTLRSHGATVEHLAAYRRMPPRLDAAQLAALRQAVEHPGRHAWLFSSSEAIDHLAALQPAADWSGARAVATHPRIAARARRLGIAGVFESLPTPDAVVACLQSVSTVNDASDHPPTPAVAPQGSGGAGVGSAAASGSGSDTGAGAGSSAGTGAEPVAVAATADGGSNARLLPPAALRWGLSAAAVLLGGLAVASLVLAWRADQRVVHLEQELVRRQQESSGRSTEAHLLAKQAEDGVRETAAKLALLEARVAEVAVQRGQLEDLIQSLSRSRDENLLVDVEAAVRVALQQSAITGSAEPLVATLKQADERLARYEQPRLDGVRRAIARDLDRVSTASVADIASLSIKLDEAVRMIDALPLLGVAEPRLPEPSGAATAGVSARPLVPAASAPGAGAGPIASAAAATTAAGDSASAGTSASASASADAGASAATFSLDAFWPSGIGELWDSVTARIWSEARALVRVTRIDRPEAMLLAPEQAFFLKENLKLRLLNARLALLSRQFETAQTDLQAAGAALDRYFDRSSRRTQLVAELFRQVSTQARQVGVPRPDDTLAALATASAGR